MTFRYASQARTSAARPWPCSGNAGSWPATRTPIPSPTAAARVRWRLYVERPQILHHLAHHLLRLTVCTQPHQLPCGAQQFRGQGGALTCTQDNNPFTLVAGMYKVILTVMRRQTTTLIMNGSPVTFTLTCTGRYSKERLARLKPADCGARFMSVACAVACHRTL